MNIDGIISISGKPGLFKVVSQATNRIIIEDIETNKRRPAFGTSKVISLADITIFGHAEDLNLGEVFQKIYDKEEGKASKPHNTESQELRDYFETVWEDYNDEEVKDHDIKKIFQWYNLLIKHNLLVVKSEEE
ncbi:MAG: hypothetical protein ACI8RY_000400 [Urechidicola sp.]|jgi:hypothetical protein|tara:strand:- start:9177 stop:9575 length:399 start_codon:yes stop_codon:yes gene_type:complete